MTVSEDDINQLTMDEWRFLLRYTRKEILALHSVANIIATGGNYTRAAKRMRVHRSGVCSYAPDLAAHIRRLVRRSLRILRGQSAKKRPQFFTMAGEDLEFLRPSDRRHNGKVLR